MNLANSIFETFAKFCLLHTACRWVIDWVPHHSSSMVLSTKKTKLEHFLNLEEDALADFQVFRQTEETL